MNHRLTILTLASAVLAAFLIVDSCGDAEFFGIIDTDPSARQVGSVNPSTEIPDPGQRLPIPGGVDSQKKISRVFSVACERTGIPGQTQTSQTQTQASQSQKVIVSKVGAKTLDHKDFDVEESSDVEVTAYIEGEICLSRSITQMDRPVQLTDIKAQVKVAPFESSEVKIISLLQDPSNPNIYHYKTQSVILLGLPKLIIPNEMRIEARDSLEQTYITRATINYLQDDVGEMESKSH